MATLRISGYWPALDVVETEKPRPRPETPAPPATVEGWLERAHAPWPALADRMCATDQARRRRYAAAEQLVTLASRHSFTVVCVLYPEVRGAAGGDGTEPLGGLVADLVSTAQLTVGLEHLMHGDSHGRPDEFDWCARRFADLLRDHVRHEQAIVPLVRALPDDRRAALLGRLLDGDRHSPSRPHPHTLAHHAMTRVAAPVERIVDLVRDALDNKGG